MKPEKITLASRILLGLFNGVIAFALIALIEFFLAIRKGVTESSLIFLNGDAIWFGAFVFFILGFILGPDKMANIWGAIFGTNKK